MEPLICDSISNKGFIDKTGNRSIERNSDLQVTISKRAQDTIQKAIWNIIPNYCVINVQQKMP